MAKTNFLSWKPKEVLGIPWTYSKETKKAIEEDKKSYEKYTSQVLSAVAESLQTYEPSYRVTDRPRKNRPLQSVNGRRAMKTTARVLNP